MLRSCPTLGAHNGTDKNSESSGNTITLIKTGAGGQMDIGGFAGLLQLTVGVEKCYSTSDIVVTVDLIDTSTVFQNYGGFAGCTEGSFTIEQCYAAGTITVISEKNEYYHHFLGGFAGALRDGVTIKDCYATGNVSIDRINGPVVSGDGSTDSGGFAGSMGAGSNTILRCFSTGDVTLISNRYDGGSTGCLIGYVFSSNTIENNVVFGGSVTIKTGLYGHNYGRVL